MSAENELSTADLARLTSDVARQIVRKTGRLPVVALVVNYVDGEGNPGAWDMAHNMQTGKGGDLRILVDFLRAAADDMAAAGPAGVQTARHDTSKGGEA